MRTAGEGEGDATIASSLADRLDVGAARSLTVVARGAMGRVYRLDTTTGPYAVKESFWAAPDDATVAGIAAFVDRCRVAGVPALRLLAMTDGAFVHVDGLDRAWTAQDWVDGVRPGPTELQATRWLMRQAALIHGLALPASAFSDEDLGWYCRIDDRWDEVLDAASRADAAWGRPLGNRLGEIREMSAMVNAVPVGPTVLCHRDLQPANTLTAADGERALLDWDNAGPHEPWREVGNTLLHMIGEDADLRDLVRVYLESGGAPLPSGVQVFATGLAVWLNFLQCQALIAVDGATAGEHTGFAHEQVAGMVDGMPTLDELDRAAVLIA